MDPFLVSVAFIVIGVLMLLAEYSAPKTYIAVPGAVLLALGIVIFIFPSWMDEWWSAIVLIIVLALLVFAAMKFFQMLAPSEQPEALAITMVGRRGAVVDEVVPNLTTGAIQFDDCTKNATATVRIPKGTQVVVIEDKGAHVVVEAADKASK
jgi:membrane protein implicated in regulation of membrane protease activity